MDWRPRNLGSSVAVLARDHPIASETDVEVTDAGVASGPRRAHISDCREVTHIPGGVSVSVNHIAFHLAIRRLVFSASLLALPRSAERAAGHRGDPSSLPTHVTSVTWRTNRRSEHSGLLPIIFPSTLPARQPLAHTCCDGQTPAPCTFSYQKHSSR
jgi:hypothetical protein